MPAKISLLTVGKQKDQLLKKIEEQYLKRLAVPLAIIESKAFSDNPSREETEILSKLKSLGKEKAKLILLSEYGTQYSSQNFSIWLEELGSSHKEIIFIIGGALGFTQEFRNRATSTLSLSSLTFPHQLTRLLFIEQIYRAQTIKQGHPYHH